MWLWVGVALAIFFLISTLVTLAFATILRRMAHEVSELLDSTAWLSAPLARERAEGNRVPLDHVASRQMGNARRNLSQGS